MKDTFDFKKFLIENRCTETTRKSRTHFGKVLLNEHVRIAVNEAADDFDDEDFYRGEEDDLDFTAGDRLASMVGGRNVRGRKAAEKAFDFDTDDDEEQYDGPETDSDDEEGSDNEAFVDPENMEEPKSSDLASTVSYDPSTVELEMDDEELNDYLNGFRRPEVAARTLQRALKAAQSEVADSPGISKVYLILKNGFYSTTNFRPTGTAGKLIATIKQSKKSSLQETGLDYDEDNFGGQYSRGQRYNIVDTGSGHVYFEDVSEEEVDDICDRLDRRGINFEVVEQ